MHPEIEPLSAEAEKWKDNWARADVPSLTGMSGFRQIDNNGRSLGRVWVAQSSFDETKVSSPQEAQAPEQMHKIEGPQGEVYG